MPNAQAGIATPSFHNQLQQLKSWNQDHQNYARTFCLSASILSDCRSLRTLVVLILDLAGSWSSFGGFLPKQFQVWFRARAKCRTTYLLWIKLQFRVRKAGVTLELNPHLANHKSCLCQTGRGRITKAIKTARPSLKSCLCPAGEEEMNESELITNGNQNPAGVSFVGDMFLNYFPGTDNHFNLVKITVCLGMFTDELQTTWIHNIYFLKFSLTDVAGALVSPAGGSGSFRTSGWSAGELQPLAVGRGTAASHCQSVYELQTLVVGRRTTALNGQ